MPDITRDIFWLRADFGPAGVKVAAESPNLVSRYV
jgi:hypothetical protein